MTGACCGTGRTGGSTLEGLLPRRTALLRAVAGEQSRGQLLCVNMDLAAVVVGLQPLPVLSRVERLVALAWESGAQPLVVLTKSDLVTDADDVAEDVAAAAPGVDVVVVSSVTGRGVEDLRDRLAGRRTLALVGASGHGKSSLTNALVGAEVLATRELRERRPRPAHLGPARAGAAARRRGGHRHPGPAGRRPDRRRAPAWPAPSPTSRSSRHGASSATAPTPASRAARWPRALADGS